MKRINSYVWLRPPEQDANPFTNNKLQKIDSPTASPDRKFNNLADYAKKNQSRAASSPELINQKRCSVPLTSQMTSNQSSKRILKTLNFDGSRD